MTPNFVSLCTFRIADTRFGIETAEIDEILGGISPQPVPLSSSFVAGIASYRGDILTVLRLSSLLGLHSAESAANVLVFSDQDLGELYGLSVDAIEGVASFDSACWQPNPDTLSPDAQSLFHGSYRDAAGLIVRLEPYQLAPARLSTSRSLPPAAAQSLEHE